jgi:hypothetical protein
VLRRIAQSGMDRILVFLNSSESSERGPLASAPDTAPFTTIPANQSPPS